MKDLTNPRRKTSPIYCCKDSQSHQYPTISTDFPQAFFGFHKLLLAQSDPQKTTVDNTEPYRMSGQATYTNRSKISMPNSQSHQLPCCPLMESMLERSKLSQI
ncbi:Uncharacterized protein Rs2_38441 [Raphanus sativus]|nr:Uncharacterized protein Rs2_38441 [Raphanus sativus]